METDAGVSLSLDDLTSFAPPLGGHTTLSHGSHDQSFDDGTTSFLSSTDTFDMVGDNTSDGYSRRTPSMKGYNITISNSLVTMNLYCYFNN